MKHKMKIKQIAVFSVVAVVCAVPLVLGVYLLFDGWIFNLPFVICYFAMPIAVAVIAYLAITSSCNVWSKLFLCGSVLLIGGCLFLFLINNCCFERLVSTTGKEAEAGYKSEKYIHENMPSLEQIGKPLGLEYHDYYAQENVHGWQSSTLIAVYSESEYEEQKRFVDEKYSFMDTSLKYYDGSACDSICTLKDYTFRMVKLKSNTLWYMLIATNDRTKEIVYLSFYCMCMDPIRSLEIFLLEDCGWEHIR